jgi:hypothetical protein
MLFAGEPQQFGEPWPGGVPAGGFVREDPVQNLAAELALLFFLADPRRSQDRGTQLSAGVSSTPNHLSTQPEFLQASVGRFCSGRPILHESCLIDCWHSSACAKPVRIVPRATTSARRSKMKPRQSEVATGPDAHGGMLTAWKLMQATCSLE